MANYIHPTAIIGDNVILGDNNYIGAYCIIGDPAEYKKYWGEKKGKVIIGNNNIIREFSMISRGTVKGGGVTQIGNDNFFMAYTHVGHDCQIGNFVTMINYSALSGHVTVHDYAYLGGYSAIHQFCHVGAYAFVARATYITKDILPYLMIAEDTSACGLNTVGLRRAGFSSSTIDNLRRAYKVIFRNERAGHALELKRGANENVTCGLW
jgi:UDP-N-acetylglucosamine acyltransferase